MSMYGDLCAYPGTTRRIFRFFAATVPALFFLLSFGMGSARAQEEEQEQEKKEEKKMVEVPLPGQGEEDDLVQRIRDGMKKIDESLLGATARDVPEKLQENIRYIEELLKGTRDQSSQVIKNLEELIKSVKYQKSGSSGQRPMPPKPEQGEQEENSPVRNRMTGS